MADENDDRDDVTSPASALVSVSELIATLGDPEADFDLEEAIPKLAQMLDSEVAAICGPVEVHNVFGCERTDSIDSELLDLAHGARREGTIDSIGWVHVVSTEIEGTSEVLLVARTDEVFSPDEQALVATAGGVFALAASMGRALEAERAARDDLQKRVDEGRDLLAQLRERQGLLDRVVRIQRSISHRAPTEEVLEAVTAGARDLLGVGRVSLRLRGTEHPDELMVVSSRGFNEEALEAINITSVSTGMAGLCIQEARLVVEGDAAIIENDSEDEVLMAAPVHVNGEVIGCLTVAGMIISRGFTPPEQEAMLVLAEHASLALQDARATDAMRNALDREKHRAAHDPLTELPNRVTLQREIESRLAKVDRVPMCVLFVDLDHFKLINDTLGHAFGDQILTTVSDRLRGSVRDQDVVGRLAGDEFIVVCDGITEVGAFELAERIQSALRIPVQRGDIDHIVTASMGIAEGHTGDTSEQVIANADLAMYRAKQHGGGGLEVYSDALRESAEEQVSVGRDLSRALENNEFVVHLQPVVELPERRVVSFEALARWNHPTRGLMFPDSFIPLAEESGVIVAIDRSIIEETMRLLSVAPVVRPIAVNLSARTLDDDFFADWLASRLAHYELSAELLTIEITETVLIEKGGVAATQLQAIREFGSAVVIDGFGTGHASLAYLQTLDVDGVKINQSFTEQLEEDPRAGAIVSAIFHVAAALGLTVVAKGLETDEQVDRIVELSERSGSIVLHGQGFLFGRPEDGAQRLAGFVEVPASPRLEVR